MPIVPNASITVNTDAVVDQAVPVGKTLAVAGTAEDLATVPVGKKCRKFSFINEGPGTAYVEVDGTATTASVPVEPKDAWSEDGVAVSTKFSFIGEPGKKPKVRGVIWCGV